MGFESFDHEWDANVLDQLSKLDLDPRDLFRRSLEGMELVFTAGGFAGLAALLGRVYPSTYARVMSLASERARAVSKCGSYLFELDYTALDSIEVGHLVRIAHLSQVTPQEASANV